MQDCNVVLGSSKLVITASAPLCIAVWADSRAKEGNASTEEKCNIIVHCSSEWATASAHMCNAVLM